MLDRWDRSKSLKNGIRDCTATLVIWGPSSPLGLPEIRPYSFRNLCYFLLISSPRWKVEDHLAAEETGIQGWLGISSRLPHQWSSLILSSQLGDQSTHIALGRILRQFLSNNPIDLLSLGQGCVNTFQQNQCVECAPSHLRDLT